MRARPNQITHNGPGIGKTATGYRILILIKKRHCRTDIQIELLCRDVIRYIRKVIEGDEAMQKQVKEI